MGYDVDNFVLPDYLNLFPAGLDPFIDAKHFGPMVHSGNDLQAKPSKSTFDPSGAEIVVAHDPTKLVASDQSLNAASETVYLVSPAGTPPMPSKFADSDFMLAELQFSHPKYSPKSPTGNAWAIELNFKSGDASDGATDYKLGGRLHFKNGTIDFRVDDGDQNSPTAPTVVGSGVALDYANATFHLRVALNRTSGEATAQLLLTHIPNPPKVLPFNFDIPLHTDTFTPLPISAVGFTLINGVISAPPLPVEQAHFRYFALYYRK